MLRVLQDALKTPKKGQFVEEWLAEIAESIFNNYKIERDNELFEIAEIEVYLENETFDDIYRHNNADHLKFEYITWHYSGIDVCFGNGRDIACGVLIRGLRNNKKTLYGPRVIAYEGRGTLKRKLKLKKLDKPLKLSMKDTINNIDEITPDLILQLPRVNLSAKATFSNIKNNCDDLLNLKARFLRLENNEFFKKKNKNSFIPVEKKEIFNGILNELKMNEYLTGTKEDENCFIREDEGFNKKFYAVSFDVKKRERKTIDFVCKVYKNINFTKNKEHYFTNIKELFVKITNNFYIMITPYSCLPGDLAGIIKNQSLKDDEQVMVVEIESLPYGALLPYQGLNKETQNNLQEWYNQSLTIKW